MLLGHNKKIKLVDLHAYDSSIYVLLVYSVIRKRKSQPKTLVNSFQFEATDVRYIRTDFFIR